MARASRYRVAGVDLAGSPARSTGYCLLTSPKVTRVRVLTSDATIFEQIREVRPDLVIIDAPLFLPAGRTSLEQRGPPHLRECDRELSRLGIRFFPLSLGPMRMLTARGIRLRRELEGRGFRVDEGYPGATQDLMGWPRKGSGTGPLLRALRRFGFRGDVARRSLTHDELDAVSCAWAGREHLFGRSWVLGDPAEGVMILPPAAPGTRYHRLGRGTPAPLSIAR